MLIIGSHVSFKSDEQLIGSVKEALSYNANTFMFYTGAPQNTKRCNLNDDINNKAKKIMKENNIDINNVIVHAPYIINLAGNNNRDFAISFLKDELKRVNDLGIKYLVLHPGSSVGISQDEGIDNLINALNIVLDNNLDVTICIETMAGKGNEICRNIEQVRKVIEGCKYKDKLGVCIDTCHLNDAGYDISKIDDYLDEFDKKIGIDKIKCVHINDSKNEIGSHKDRHENIGYGTIGFNNLINVIYNKRLDNIPLILETPYIDKLAPYKKEIEIIRSKKYNDWKKDL